jgi:hypothetical protein
MQSATFRKLTSVFITAVSALLLLSSPSVQAENCSTFAVVNPITDYLPTFPWMGLVVDEVTYGPITVSDVHINKGNKLAVVKPGEMLHGHLHYQVDSTNQHLFHRYHLVVGIKGLGAQDCDTHTYGVWDSSGKGKFSLKAPLEPGVYEVRFCYQEAHTCEEARSVWNENMGEPSSYATIGVIVVE